MVLISPVPDLCISFTFIVVSRTNGQRPWWSPLDTMGEIVSFTVSYTKSRDTLILLNKLLFSLFFHPLPPDEEGNVQSD